MLVLGLSEISATEVTVALANFSNTVADDSSTSKAELTVFEFSPADTDVDKPTETEEIALDDTDIELVEASTETEEMALDDTDIELDLEGTIFASVFLFLLPLYIGSLPERNTLGAEVDEVLLGALIGDH